jgi:hypothetical protein
MRFDTPLHVSVVDFLAKRHACPKRADVTLQSFGDRGGLRT